MMSDNKRLYRSRTNKMIAGVCAGVGEYANIDPTVVRLLFVLITIFSTVLPGLLAYLLMVIIIPEEPTPLS
jgi:phage shock protein PspC (stress-responsive transcriptional regulator)